MDNKSILARQQKPVKNKYYFFVEVCAEFSEIECMSTDYPLDGTYRVTTTTSYQGPLEKKSDGQTEIVEGKTHRYDAANCKWTSSFEIISDVEVRMVSVADPSEAEVDFLLTAPDGSPTRDVVEYEATLKLSRKGNLIQMSGQIHYGHDVVFLTMRKIDG